MAWTPFLLFLSMSYTGARAQFVLTQPPSIAADTGTTVQISCTRNSGSISSYYVSWYQQKPGNAPKLVIYQFSNRPTGIPDRFTGSYEKSANSATLSISNLQAEDEADYYCLSYDGSYQWVFGGGTHLTVTGQPVAHPVVSLFPPSQEELKSKDKATLACLMDGFHPGVVQVEWLGDGRTISSGVETTKPVKQGDKYIASSYLTLSRSEWEANKSYTCKVTHESKITEKVVSQLACS
ncbi:immunoglobulin lambda-1 light chain isoform X2 [Anolis carolinensis]|uniref:immunoglobulin lambda-1 light chain isoform X2 n=1 Tax=Anolis carolinensis TaxID=28377 RepID=UPI002F2B2576